MKVHLTKKNISVNEMEPIENAKAKSRSFSTIDFVKLIVGPGAIQHALSIIELTLKIIFGVEI